MAAVNLTSVITINSRITRSSLAKNCKLITIAATAIGELSNERLSNSRKERRYWEVYKMSDPRTDNLAGIPLFYDRFSDDSYGREARPMRPYINAGFLESCESRAQSPAVSTALLVNTL